MHHHIKSNCVSTQKGQREKNASYSPGCSVIAVPERVFATLTELVLQAAMEMQFYGINRLI